MFVSIYSSHHFLHVQTACSPADSADHAEEYSRAALFRRERHVGISVVLGFVCVNLRETHGVLFGDWLSKLACLSPADYADYADEYSKLYYFAEKDRLGFVYFGETA